MRYNECKPPSGAPPTKDKTFDPNPKKACAIVNLCALLHEFSA